LKDNIIFSPVIMYHFSHLTNGPVGGAKDVMRLLCHNVTILN